MILSSLLAGKKKQGKLLSHYHPDAARCTYVHDVNLFPTPLRVVYKSIYEYGCGVMYLQMFIFTSRGWKIHKSIFFHFPAFHSAHFIAPCDDMSWLLGSALRRREHKQLRFSVKSCTTHSGVGKALPRPSAVQCYQVSSPLVAHCHSDRRLHYIRGFIKGMGG